MHAAMNDFLLGKEGLRASMSKEGDNSHSTTAGGSAVSAGTTMDASQPHNHREPQPSVGDVPKIVPPAVDGGALQKSDEKTEEKKLGELVNPETLATLSCEAYGGPDTEAAQEMVSHSQTNPFLCISSILAHPHVHVCLHLIGILA
jgi:hypothetical protein